MDAVGINKMKYSSANLHSGVSKRHQNRGLHAVLAEVLATGTGACWNATVNDASKSFN